MNVTKTVFKAYTDLKDKIDRNKPRARSLTLDKIIKDTDPYVPYKTGELARSTTKSADNTAVLYTAPHASFAFDPNTPSGVPKQYNKTVHEKAQGNPLEAARKDHETEWAEFYREELLKGVE